MMRIFSLDAGGSFYGFFIRGACCCLKTDIRNGFSTFSQGDSELAPISRGFLLSTLSDQAQIVTQKKNLFSPKFQKQPRFRHTSPSTALNIFSSWPFYGAAGLPVICCWRAEDEGCVLHALNVPIRARECD